MAEVLVAGEKDEADALQLMKSNAMWYNTVAATDGGITMSLAKVTSKGQITIPKDVRDTLGISESDYVVVVVDGSKAILRPVQKSKLVDLKGRLPATRPYPGTDEIRREIGRELGRRGRRTSE